MLPQSADTAPVAPRPVSAGRLLALLVIAVVVAALVLVPLLSDLGAAFRTEIRLAPAAPVDPGAATVVLGAPQTLDPAAAGDAGSAAIIAQLFEGLTTVDADLVVRPALAESWRFEDGGRTVIFELRDGLTFSDGTPLTAADVVDSWFRVLLPAAPSPLAALLDDVVGAAEYRTGGGSRDRVGLTADGRTLTVHLTRPATDFPAVAASPTLSVVPPTATIQRFMPSADFVASGGYRATSATTTGLVLEANPSYWAGPPAIGRIDVKTSLDGRSPVAVFQDGEADLTSIGSYDASWIAFDRDIGPSLRKGVSLSVEYLGFDTTSPPFDDARVRRAFGTGVDWRRVVGLGSDSTEEVATSIVPPAVPGRTTADMLPPFDLAGARALLAEAGYPGGAGFPAITFTSAGNPYAPAIVDQLRENLGIDISIETMDFTQYYDRLETDPPAMWSVDWVADYPARTALLGLLLGPEQPSNFGRWTDPAYASALAQGGAATDPAVANAAYDRAEGIVRDQVPVVPLSYGTSWFLARDGLLGATENGLGFIRLAGLAWADR
jgi:oligopeptide transport system substrate-binding protein